MYGAKATYKPRDKARAIINRAEPMSLDKCAVYKSQLNTMNDEQAERVISQSVAVLSASQDSTYAYSNSLLERQIRQPKTKSEKQNIEMFSDTAKHYNDSDILAWRSQIRTEFLTDATLKTCALQVLKHFKHFAIEAAPYVIALMEEPSLNTEAAETLRQMHPLDREHISRLKHLEQTTKLVTTRTLVPYALGTRGPSKIGGGPPLTLPEGASKTAKQMHEIEVFKEKANLVIRHLREASQNPPKRGYEDDVTALNKKLENYQGEHPYVAEIMVINEACKKVMPQRNVEALRKLCEQEKSKRCKRAYKDAIAMFRQYPVREFNCITTTNAFIYKRAFAAMDKSREYVTGLNQQRRPQKKLKTAAGGEPPRGVKRPFGSRSKQIGSRFAPQAEIGK